MPETAMRPTRSEIAGKLRQWFCHLCGALDRIHIHSGTSMGNLNTERVVLVNHILGLSVFYPAFFLGSEYWFELKGTYLNWNFA